MSSSSDGARPLLALCYGTRPQVIKMSALGEALGQRYDLLTVDTGQHYEPPVNALLHQQLGVPTPNHALETGSAPAGASIENIRARAAAVLAGRRPAAVVVIGDTNSTAGSTRAARDLGIPVVHVEAGLRMSGPPSAEELIRREVDRVSRLLCAPSAHAVANLARERVRGTVELTGDIALDVLLRNIDQARPIAGEPDWPIPAGTPFVLATLHRAELVDVPELLREALVALGELGLPVILPVHPRLRAALATSAIPPFRHSAIHLLPPLGYLQVLAAVRDAAVVVTDSGGLQREAYWLGTPCVTLRDETEWVETVACGANILVPPSRAGAELRPAVHQSLNPPLSRSLNPPIPHSRTAYGTGDAGRRIADAIGWILT